MPRLGVGVRGPRHLVSVDARRPGGLQHRNRDRPQSRRLDPDGGSHASRRRGTRHTIRPSSQNTTPRLRAFGAASGGEQGASERITTLTAGRRHLVRKHTYWLGTDGWAVPEWHVWDVADIAVGRLDGFRSGQTPSHPVFRSVGSPSARAFAGWGSPSTRCRRRTTSRPDRFELAPGTLRSPGS